MSIVNPEWALRLVARWCENRADQKSDVALLRRLRKSYKAGPIATPAARFADQLEMEIAGARDRWMKLARQMRDEAAKKGTGL